MTDTVPEAITQADDDLAHEIMLRVRGHAVRLPQKGHWLKQALARHRRLAAHGAGEGLREALSRVREWVASLTVTDMNEIVADGGITASMVVGQEAVEQLRRIDRALTPPTDAESTTREGGEGVLAEREACARIADELADDPHDIGANIAARIRNRTEQDSFLALATTSSPDASPDSGETAHVDENTPGALRPVPAVQPNVAGVPLSVGSARDTVITALRDYLASAGVPETEFDPEFVVRMEAAMMVSFHKYGRVADAYPVKFDAVSDMRARIKKYRETGNLHFLADVANFAMIETMHPARSDATWGSNDAADSPGRTTASGHRLVQEDNAGNRIMGETILHIPGDVA